MPKQIGLPVVLIIAVASALAQKSAIRGTVVDSEGAVISKAYVLFHSDTLDREHPAAYQLELRTNKHGKFTAALPSGFFDLFIGAVGFAPYSQKVRTIGGAPQDIRVALKVDPLMVKEYGDEFPVTPQVETRPSSVPPTLQDSPH